MTPDRITVSVIQHRLEAIVQEMGEAMLRTAYSQILNSSRDFSTAVFDGRGRLAAQAEHVPIHVGALPWAVQSVSEYFAGRIRPGDLFLLNDPYHGNNHLPDLTVLLPIFAEGQLVFWSINRAHQQRIGPSAQKSRQRAQRCTHAQRERNRRQARQQRQSRAMQHARQNILAQRIGPKPMRSRGPLGHFAADRVQAVGRNEISG